MVSDKKIFSRFPYIKHVTPETGSILAPGANIQKKFVEVLSTMLHTKYQGSRPCGFRQEDFSLYKPM